MTEEATVLRRHLDRERRARKAAEELLEEKSYQLYQANLALRKVAGQLEERVEERTIELLTANAQLQDEIAERRRIEQELEHARDVALQMSRLKSEFLATMSHEIRTPMNGIMGMSEILLGTDLDDEQREYATIAYEESQKLLEIINSILDLSKIEAGKVVLEETEFAPTDEIWGVLRLLAPKADAKGITLRYAGTANLPAVVIGDALRLRQILSNLIGNAVKFTREGSVTVSVTRHHQPHCILPQRRAVAELEFVIEDTGIGMSPLVVQNLFNPFSQADSSTTRRYGGTGLGLAITKRLVDLIGGRLHVESQPHTGSKFVVLLPYRLQEVSASPEIGVSTAPLTPTELVDRDGPQPWCPGVADHPNGSEPLPHAEQATGGENQGAGPTVGDAPAQILVVEDYRNNQLVVLAHLKKLGYQAEIAENGQVAVDKLTTNREQYQLVLMDWQMPVMDGLEATRCIRTMESAGDQHIPIIGMTANAIKGDRERCLAAGMDDYLSKPLKREELYRILSTWAAVKR
jgi:signal transduction histidine kinase/ActR/RegA family two-component response regulator